MKVSVTVAVFHVSNLQASLKYYLNILGFTEDFKHGDAYAGVKMGDAGLHLMSGRGPRAVGAATAYFFCDEVDSYYRSINNKGALVRGEPQEYAYGMRDFTVEDLDGNHLTFGCAGASQ